MYKKTFRRKLVKEKTSGNIKDYLTSKVLHILSKPHSPQTIKFIEDPYDSWFVHVITYKTKAGSIVDSNMIIAKDIEDWTNLLIHNGYEFKK